MALTISWNGLAGTPGFPCGRNPGGQGLPFSHTQHSAGSEGAELPAGWMHGRTIRKDSDS